MHTVTVLFRLCSDPDRVEVAIGTTDVDDAGTPRWHRIEPIVGAYTSSEWEELVRPHVERFAKTLGITGLHGGRLAYSGTIHAMMEFDFDSPFVDGKCICDDNHASTECSEHPTCQGAHR